MLCKNNDTRMSEEEEKEKDEKTEEEEGPREPRFPSRFPLFAGKCALQRAIRGYILTNGVDCPHGPMGTWMQSV